MRLENDDHLTVPLFFFLRSYSNRANRQVSKCDEKVQTMRSDVPSSLLPPSQARSFRARFQHLLVLRRSQFLHRYNRLDVLIISIYLAHRWHRFKPSNRSPKRGASRMGSSNFLVRFQHLPVPSRSQFLHRYNRLNMLITSVYLIYLWHWIKLNNHSP